MKPETISIKTLPIEIHVVRVGNRQMTKAVFKQIPLISNDYVIDYIDEDNFTILGWINENVQQYDLPRNEFKNEKLNEKGYWCWIVLIIKNELRKTFLPWKYVSEYPQLFIAI